MVYQLHQTYPFACPQAKHTGQSCERGLKTAETYTILNLLLYLSNVANHIRSVPTLEAFHVLDLSLATKPSSPQLS